MEEGEEPLDAPVPVKGGGGRWRAWMPSVRMDAANKRRTATLLFFGVFSGGLLAYGVYLFVRHSRMESTTGRWERGAVRFTPNGSDRSFAIAMEHGHAESAYTVWYDRGNPEINAVSPWHPIPLMDGILSVLFAVLVWVLYFLM
jgi:hypothetical protein